MARLELRSPGVEQFASVDDLSEFRGSANSMCMRVYDAHKELDRRVGLINKTMGVLLRHAVPAAVAACTADKARAAAVADAVGATFPAADDLRPTPLGGDAGRGAAAGPTGPPSEDGAGGAPPKAPPATPVAETVPPAPVGEPESAPTPPA